MLYTQGLTCQIRIFRRLYKMNYYLHNDNIFTLLQNKTQTKKGVYKRKKIRIKILDLLFYQNIFGSTIVLVI